MRPLSRCRKKECGLLPRFTGGSDHCSSVRRRTGATAPRLMAFSSFRREERKMGYVDGFVIAVPAANKEAYRSHAAAAAPIFKEFGATRVVECWGDDVPDGKITDFRGAVHAKEGEVVCFSWIEYPSKEVRDAANRKMMEDPRMEAMGADMPFDGKRMIFGGFAPIVDTAA
jgi:uncharacterized protein YbaA (DUF1428 family)